MSRTREHVLHLGPADAGSGLEHDEFLRAVLTPGHRYEVVAGKLAVTPAPNMSHWQVQTWFLERLDRYARERPDVLALAATASRVVTRALGAVTDVEPDVAAYREFPRGSRSARWEDVTPFLVVEVISGSDPRKDLVRNREVYGCVSSIQEYWIVDPRPEPAPSMLALFRGAEGWVERAVPAGETYRSDLLPGLTLDLSTIFTRP